MSAAGSPPVFPAHPAAARAADAIARLDQPRPFAARLWSKDDTIWSGDPAHRAVARNRLGWLDAVARMQPRFPELSMAASDITCDGFTHAVLLGMGGSSLAPEVLRRTFGARSGYLDLSVLDNTSPAAVRHVMATHDPERTFFLVSSKSGATIEVASFEKAFFAWVAEARGKDAGRSFAAITDPGTVLEKLAAERGYRKVWSAPPDVGGRYSALTEFGLVPAALMGVDLGALLAAAEAEAMASGPDVHGAANAGVALGAWLGALALEHRDKLTLVLGEEIAALGGWIEQLVAESTGKNGRGVVPVAGEALAAPDGYRGDRVFVAASARPFPRETEARLDALAAAGHPVIRWTLPSLAAIGGEFLRWEIATATASAVLGVDPFDEPNVTEAKQATQAVLARFLETGALPARAPVARSGDTQVECPGAIENALRDAAGGRDHLSGWLAALLGTAGAGDYVALLAYLHATPARQERLQSLRHACRAVTRCATTLGIGPRFLHSTGQLHKGGAGNGVFVQITADEGDDLPIPGERYGFGVLRAAQADGDYEVLARRDRRVIRLHLGAGVERALDGLIAGVSAARV